MAVGIPLDEDKTKAVLRQVEFYFSDSNLPRDNFLRKTVQDSQDGLVSLALICSFSRMRTHLGLGTMGADEIPEEMVQAVAVVLRNSSSLRVSEDGKTIGRNSKLLKPEEVLEQVDSRMIAASPLPYDVQIEVLESFFGQHGKVNSVRLPRHVADKRHFCGTALIEFSNEEEAEKLLKECLVYAGADLEIKPKKDFDAEVEGMKGDFEKPRSNKNASNGSYPKGLIISFKLESIQTEEATEQTDASKAEVPNSTGSVKEDEEKTSATDNKDDKSFESVENNNVEKAAEDEQDTELKSNNNASEEGNAEITKSSTGERTGKDENVVTREDLKRIFQKFGTVKYIDYQMGGESGYIRFEDPEAAVEARAVAVLGDQGGLVVKNFIAILEALTGDAEKEYWSALRGFQDSRRGRGGRNSRGGRHFDGKRSGRRFDSADGRSNKAQKISSDL